MANDLNVKIGGDISEIRVALAQLKGEFGRLGQAATQAGTGMGAVFSGSLLAGAVTQAAREIATFVRGLTNGIDALNDLKDATGASIENLSALEDVADRNGTAFGTVGAALTKLNKDLAQATPGSQTAETLKAIGLNAQELRKLDPAEALLKVALALDGFADSGSKARIIAALFGKSVQEVGPFLKDLAEKGALNATVTTKQAEEAERFNKQLFELRTGAKELARSFSNDLLPALNGMLKTMRDARAEAAGGSLLDGILGTNPVARLQQQAKLATAAVKGAGMLFDKLLDEQQRKGGPGADSALDARIAAQRERMDKLRSDAAKAADALKNLGNVMDGGPKKPEEAKPEKEKPTAPEPPDVAGMAAAASARKALLQAELEGHEKLSKDAGKRALDILKEDYAEAKIATAAYYAERERIELEAIDREIAIEKEKAKAGPVEARKAIDEIALLERQKNDVRRKAQREEQADREKLDKQRADAQIQLLEQQGKTADAAALRIDAQFKDLRARLVADGNTAGVALIDNLIDTGKAKSNFDQIRADFDKLVADLARRRQEIANQVQIGAITPAVGREREEAAAQNTMQRLAEMRQKLQALAADPDALPAVKQAAEEANAAFLRMQTEGLTGFDKAAANLRAQLEQMRKGFADLAVNAGVDALTGLFTDLADGTEDAGEALKDFVRGFAQSMAQIAARALAMWLILQVIPEPYRSMVGAGMQISANVKHAGGIAGQGGPKRNVPGWVFAGAPRYHNGGMVGIKPGEVPAILQAGEEVLPRSDPRHVANAVGVGKLPTPVIVFGEDELANALAGKAGEQVVVHHVRNNRRAIDE